MARLQPENQALTIQSLQTGASSVLCTLSVRDEYLHVSDSLLDDVIKQLPTLPRHACARNGIGEFADKMYGTLLPHLVEHVAIDLLVRTYEKETVGFAGNTSWLDKEASLLQVRVSYQDIRVTEAALIAAVELINFLIEQGDDITVPEMAHHPSPCIMDILQDLHSIKCDQSF